MDITDRISFEVDIHLESEMEAHPHWNTQLSVRMCGDRHSRPSAAAALSRLPAPLHKASWVYTKRLHGRDGNSTDWTLFLKRKTISLLYTYSIQPDEGQEAVETRARDLPTKPTHWPV